MLKAKILNQKNFCNIGKNISISPTRNKIIIILPVGGKYGFSVHVLKEKIIGMHGAPKEIEILMPSGKKYIENPKLKKSDGRY